VVYKPRFIDQLFPATCLLCGAGARGGLDACAGCIADLPLNGSACLRCAMPVQAGALCGHCLGEPPLVAGAFCAFRYAWPVRELLLRFKTGGDLAAGRLLSELMARQLDASQAVPGGDWALVPVPLAPRRIGERGFNQAERIARVLGGRLGLAVEPGLVRRVRSSQDQKGLSAAERRRNLDSAFSARPCAGRKLVLVDDVLTTGATTRALARALLEAGAGELRLWCLARAV
jgi:ComF family protein